LRKEILTNILQSTGGISVGDIGFTLKKEFDKVFHTGTVVSIFSGAGKI
jgi:hypothetical protein